MKKIILLDMDDTIADFCRDPAFNGMVVTDQNCTVMYEPGFFLRLQPVKGALQAVRRLIRMGYDVQIATQPVAESPHCYAEKVKWLGMWFPELVSKVNMVQNKGLLKADYLVDDRADKWKIPFEANGGTFVPFAYCKPWMVENDRNQQVWESIVEFFEKEKQKHDAKT